MTNNKEFLVGVLNQLIPQTNLITQSGSSQWKLARPVAGMESFADRNYSSKEEIIDAIATFYAGNVSGLRTGEASRTDASDVPHQRKAV